MLHHIPEVQTLDSIPGLRMMGISAHDGKVPEIEVHLEYETAKSLKHYCLIAGINGLRIELENERKIR